MKIVSGHQPVYLPWLGLIHKAKLADVFIFMDDVQYLTQDWNNRNKIKNSQGQGMWLTVPVNLKESKSNILKDVLITKEKGNPKKFWNQQHWNSIQACYGKSPFFKEYQGFFQWLYLEKEWEFLAELNLTILRQVFSWFGIEAELVMASEQNFTGVKSDLVLEHGLKFNADIVLTGIHGKDYIKQDDFSKKGMRVVFQEYNHPHYTQRFGEFVPYLSFIDLLFNHGKDASSICFSNNLTRDILCQQNVNQASP